MGATRDRIAWGDRGPGYSGLAFAGTVFLLGLFEGGFHPAEEVGALGGVLHGGAFLLELRVGVRGGLDGETDAALRLVQADDAGLDFLAGLEHVLHLGDALLGDLGDVDEAVEVAFERDERAEAGDLADGALDLLADLEAVLDGLPGILGELFQPERDALVGLVDAEHLGLHGVALLDDFRGVGRLAGPGHVGDVDHAVDALLQLHEGAVGGGVAHHALDRTAHRVTEVDLIPRVGFEVADGEGELLLVLADADDDGLDLLAFLENVAGPGDAPGPGQLGDVDETLDAGFQLHKGAVGDEAGDLAANLEVDRVFLGDLVPRIFGELLEAEGDAEALLVDLEEEDFQLLADLEEVGRVGEAAPGHVGDVEEAVEAVEVEEGAELGEVLDAAFHLGALFEVGEKLGALLVAFLLDELAAGEDDVLAVLVQFDDAALDFLAHELAEVLGRVDVDLGGGEEGFDADVDGEAALHDALDDAFDGLVGLAEFDDFLPVLLLGGLLAGEDDEAVLVFETFEEHLDLAADGEVVGRAEFIDVDGAFGLVADVDHHLAGTAFNDAAADDRAFAEILHRLGEKSFEIGHMVVCFWVGSGGWEAAPVTGRLLGRRFSLCG